MIVRLKLADSKIAVSYFIFLEDDLTLSIKFYTKYYTVQASDILTVNVDGNHI